MKTLNTTTKKVASLLVVLVAMMSFNELKAQIPCTDKGYFFITGTDSFHKTVVVSNIIKGDIFWCTYEGKKMTPDNPKLKLFTDAVKAKNPTLETLNNYIPDNYGLNPFTKVKMGNDYESVKKAYDIIVNNIKPYTLIKVELKDQDFQ